jgi:hypothetical protein
VCVDKGGLIVDTVFTVNLSAESYGEPTIGWLISDWRYWSARLEKRLDVTQKSGALFFRIPTYLVAVGLWEGCVYIHEIDVVEQ